VYVHVTV